LNDLREFLDQRSLALTLMVTEYSERGMAGTDMMIGTDSDF